MLASLDPPEVHPKNWWEVGLRNWCAVGGIKTNYINSITTQPTAAVESGHRCPKL